MLIDVTQGDAIYFGMDQEVGQVGPSHAAAADQPDIDLVVCSCTISK